MNVIFVDVDGVICTNTHGKYDKAKAIKENIEKINKLYDGNKIILWTSRGYTTGIDWTEVTERQLKKWNVKYHKLMMNKPQYDFWIDDKCINISDFNIKNFEKIKSSKKNRNSNKN